MPRAFRAAARASGDRWGGIDDNAGKMNVTGSLMCVDSSNAARRQDGFFISSGLFSGFGCGVVFGDQFGPDTPPVERAQFAARYGAVGRALNLNTPVNRDGSCAVAPLADQHRAYGQFSREVRGAVDFGEVDVEIHTPYVSGALMLCQALRASRVLARCYLMAV